ncbi:MULTISPECIES: branched-chain amino acid ABC transporter permease [Paenibacillus]|jgi:branched-chain amino acid transport system permease protein|uniref:Branched-chain amino acid ABC transporter permease n=2 Tax=Paenibacillus TaxID=44249 RepID=A0ABX3GG49_9BACL|nr:branched-chain amino acid ABC transporter permease [Paenibacillus odorifer]AIQ72786.1 ABC transporter permease [Paenibacillus odorifer]OMC66767.1 branched-chain amino acid ABC transporter permease [Paenibacillus odorifer]OMC79543.1 branched-chain amino acid ABC transporter permease [Paenibacillus odorifer]OMD15733.1 branched-chain amino acid ABC transporter permease [Paenibacillus odorifer]OMD17809.1 branched-chain amino acid ABC transporter permease [Paenibacillus odorifer]
MEYFIQQLINGISVGSIYALIALGYTMVYGIIKLINFAHGDVFMVGSFIGLFSARYLASAGLPPILVLLISLVISMTISALLGMSIERLAYKPLRKASRIAVLITAIGVSFLLEYSGVFVLGPQAKGFPEILNKQQYNLFGSSIQVDSNQIMILGTTVILMIILQYIVHRTKIGKAMRAVSFDMEAARLMGINVDRTISATFAIGSALAAAAGVIFGMTYNSVDPMMGVLPGLKAFVAAVLGGIGSIPGALVGGLLLGTVETEVSSLGYSSWRDGVAFAVLILILIFKPSGLFGKNVREKV